MRKLMHVIVFTMILQMALAPLDLSLVGVAYAEDAQSCAQIGKVLDSTTGRCVIANEVVTQKVRANSCDGLTGDEYRDCFKENAQQGVRDLEADGMKGKASDVQKGSWHRYSLPIVGGLIAGWYLLRNKKTYEHCSQTSMWLMLGGAVSGLTTEIIAQSNYKKKLKEEYKWYKNKVSGTESNEEQDSVEKATDAQTDALRLMVKQEEARKKAATTRRGGHTLAGVLYASAAVYAIVEQIQSGGAGNCMADAKTESTEPTQAPNNESQEPGDNSDGVTLNIENLWFDQDFKKEFGEYSYLKEVTPQEFIELVLRKVYANLAIGSAFAQEPAPIELEEVVVTAPSTGSGKLQGMGLEDLQADIKANMDKEMDELGKRLAEETKKSIAENSKVEAPDFEGNLENSGGTSTFQKWLKNPLGKKLTKWVDQGISKPWVRGALAGTLAGYSAALVASANKNKKIAEERIKGINDLVADFEDNNGASFQSCSEEQRKNPASPECYCYNEDGTRNQQRVNREVCVAYTSNKYISAGKYGGLGSQGYVPVKACFKDGGEIDEGCKVCEKQPSRCPAIAKAQLGNLSFGGSLGMTELVKQSNGLATGRLAPSDLDTANLYQMAARVKDAKDKIIAKDKKYKAVADKMAALERDFAKAAPSLFKKSFGSNPQELASLSDAALPLPTALQNNEKVKEALKAVDKKSTMGSGGSVAGKGKKSDDFDFGFGDSAGGVEIDDSSEIMQKDFAIKGDIHKNPDNNIFQILSLRYQRSGLRRLFDADGKSQADSANETDINEK